MMAKPKPGRCVHCLQNVDAITADHLFPRSWYPVSTPPNLQKWTIPACEPCNKAYGKIEEELRSPFAACLGRESVAGAGLWQSVLDSMNPERAKSPLDKLKRQRARARFKRGLIPASSVTSDDGVLPEIRPRERGSHALLISEPAVRRLIEKLVRGTVYLTDKRYIERGRIGYSFMTLDVAQPVQRLIEEFGELYERAPGIRIRKAQAEEAPHDPMFVFDLWDQFRVYAWVDDELGEEDMTAPAG